MEDLMLDLETLATTNNAVITQIGACYFDRETAKIGDTFLMNIKIEDSIGEGFDIDGGALKFWFDQPAKNRTFLNNPQDIYEVKTRFWSFAVGAKFVWSHATFDFCLITNFYHRLKGELPFHYSSTRDIRTLVDLADCQKDDDAVRTDAHDALRDCIYQVGYVTNALNKLKVKHGEV